ncbi:helix-turn-helix domain-containing protein [Heyndrickxia oleronia]|uniref:helix-turn-helix domain-containing protein n=1 Tax=Heyndrickxia oleronia TaxID=38875 RepID=UPI00242A57FC|nr:helix-turn-helix domain-containing protein [Heyndrickxia oleronia]MCI1614234.1 helix-turn-helix domain-containing protein [Heyndrickxia oleronia]MCI1745110.1 helix-turn-helix domain-containing protein [Heyndrickxia oleronia]MCI1762194.1 helix-turn-helix domain-containing protein [Heyndrickxia oleronia]
MKKLIKVIAGAESFHNLSTFIVIEDMNKTVRIYRDIIKSSISRSDVQTRLIALLEVLKRHSCKQIGVSYMSKNTIADKLELSYKTVQRLMKKLEELGMIRQIPMKRKSDMLQTANAIQIIPTKNDVSDKTPPKKSEKCPTIKTNSSFLKQNINNKRKAIVSFAQANFIASWVPEQFGKLANCFYHEANTINEFWKVVIQNNPIINHVEGTRAFNDNQVLSIGIRSFKEFVMKVKSGMKIKNIFGYFNGIVNKIMDKLYFDDEFMGLTNSF